MNKLLIALVMMSTQAMAATSYEKDLKPIIMKRCAMCHNPSVPDRNWQKYEVLKRHKAQVRRRVVELMDMPPSGLPLPAEERQVFKKWLDDGVQP